MADVVMDLARTPIRGITPDATLREAAAELTHEGVGGLLVDDGTELCGVLTEHDIARALGSGAEPDEDRVESYMTTDIVTIAADRPLREAANVMSRHGIRHLLVVDEEDEPMAVISARDLLTVIGGPSADLG